MDELNSHHTITECKWSGQLRELLPLAPSTQTSTTEEDLLEDAR